VRTARIAGLVAAGALLLTATVPASAADKAMVRVLHGSPDAPSVDVFVNDAKVGALSGAEFGEVTDYVSVDAGSYGVKVCATADSTVCPIGPIDLTFAAGRKYTVAASDLLAQIKADVFTDGSATAGKASVRVVHLSADTPAVDVLTQDGSAKVVENLGYPDATGYLKLAPGSYDLKVCASSDNTVCPLDPGALDLKGGVAYTVFAVGALQPGDGVKGMTAVVAVDSMTAPATDTDGVATGGTGSPTPQAAWLLALAGAGVLGTVLASRRLAAARVRSAGRER
jgi:hypothetical protein